MKFGQLTEYNMGKTFLEKLYAKCDGEAIPRPFPKRLNLGILLTKSLKFYTACFYYMLS